MKNTFWLSHSVAAKDEMQDLSSSSMMFILTENSEYKNTEKNHQVNATEN